eukprot:847943_1
MVISIVICGYAMYRDRRSSAIFIYCNFRGMVKSANFALYLSGIVIIIFWVFRNDVQCELDWVFIITSFSFIGLLVVGSECVLVAVFWELVIGLLVVIISAPFLIVYILYLMILCCCKKKYKSVKTHRKVLLVGNHDAGTSTLFEMFKLYPNEQNLDVLITEARSAVRQNCVLGILSLLKQSQDLYNQNPQQNHDCLMDLTDEVQRAITLIVNYKSESLAQYLQENELQALGRAIHKIWRLDSIQTTFSLRDTEYRFPVNLDYFFDKINHIMTEDFTPTKEEALKCKLHKPGSIEHNYVLQDGTQYQLIDSSAISNGRGYGKWIRQFNISDRNDVIVFVAALDHYNIVTDLSGNTRNAMHEAINLFDEINSKFKISTILFLSRDDLFRDKLRQQIPLSLCFSASVGWEGEEWNGPDYTPIDDYDYEDKQHYEDCYVAATNFIQNIFSTRGHSHVISVTSRVNKIFVWDVKDIINKQNLNGGGLL